MDYTSKNVARFWAKVNKDGSIPTCCPELGSCWEWTGGGNGQGYGQIRINYRQMGAHQVAWELTHGAIPKGSWILHKCDNRACVNPDHLFLGTAKRNMTDMVAKGQRDTGKGKPRHRLTRLQVLDLKSRYANGESKASLARDFNIAYNTVSNIVNGRTRNR